MKNLTRLNKEELIHVNGGKSFAYRAGQACAIIWDLGIESDHAPTTTGGILALIDWFG